MQMPTNRKDSGFTLIEMAIVLVIIGLIIGAVLKGQDLIQNARAKKFVNFARAAEIAQWTFMDRTGHFAGDADANGVFDAAVQPSETLFTNFSNPPEGNLTLGSYTYQLWYGYDNGTNDIRPLIIIDPAGSGQFSDDELVFVESLDTAIDGVSNATDGNVICADGNIKTGTYISTTNNATASECNASGAVLLYYFDKPNR